MKALRQVSKIMHGAAQAESDMELRHKWTVKEEAASNALFSEQIENHSISLAQVRSISQNDSFLS